MITYLFDEVLLDPSLITDYGDGSPTFGNTTNRNPTTGFRSINVGRFDPKEAWTIALKQMNAAERAYFLRFWRGGYGSAIGFRVSLPSDYTATAQPLGTITASQTKAFQLVKTYTRPGVTAREDVRKIIKPVVRTNLASGSATLTEPDGTTPRVIEVAFAVTVGGFSSGFTYTINNTTGILTVTTTTASGQVAATFQFDTPMAFTENGFQGTFDVESAAQGVGLEELLPGGLGL